MSLTFFASLLFSFGVDGVGVLLFWGDDDVGGVGDVWGWGSSMFSWKNLSVCLIFFKWLSTGVSYEELWIVFSVIWGRFVGY